ncbi:MAG: hypothetical protein M3O22_02285 [Pseudomonadota bacterium]|nr:hypothetical protein [Pseudomonadota bacterium]
MTFNARTMPPVLMRALMTGEFPMNSGELWKGLAWLETIGREIPEMAVPKAVPKGIDFSEGEYEIAAWPKSPPPPPARMYRNLLVGCVFSHLLDKYGLERGRFRAAEEYLEGVLNQSQAAGHGRKGQSLITGIAFVATGFDWMEPVLNNAKDDPSKRIDMYQALFSLVDLPPQMEQRLESLRNHLDSGQKISEDDRQWLAETDKRARNFIAYARSADPGLQRSLLLGIPAEIPEHAGKLKTMLQDTITGPLETRYTLDIARRNIAKAVEAQGVRGLQNLDELQTALSDTGNPSEFVADACRRLMDLFGGGVADPQKEALKDIKARLEALPDPRKPPLTGQQTDWLDTARKWALGFCDQIVKQGTAEERAIIFTAFQEGRKVEWKGLPENLQKVFTGAWKSALDLKQPVEKAMATDQFKP